MPLAAPLLAHGLQFVLLFLFAGAIAILLIAVTGSGLRRADRWRRLPPPPPAPEDLLVEAEMMGVYLGTVPLDEPTVWLKVHDLGIVAAGTLLSVPEGVVVERASGRPFLIVDPEVALVRRGGEELVVVRWLLGDAPVESRFRPDDREEALAWAS